MRGEIRVRRPTCAILTFGIVMISLVHIYFDEVGVPIVPILGVFVFVMVHAVLLPPYQARGVKREVLATATLLLIAFVSSAYWGQVRWGGIYPKAVLGFALGLGVLVPVLWNGGSPVYRAYLGRAVSAALAVHVVAWVVQAALFRTTGQYLDYVELITGMPSRFVWGSGDPGFFVVRPTGLFAEPTVYATYIVVSVGARLWAASGRMRVVDYVGLGTVALSLSLVGYVILGVLLLTMSLTVWWHRRRTLLTAVVGVVVGVTILAQDQGPVGRYVRVRLEAPTHDASGWERLVKGFVRIEELPLDGRLFGLGLGNYDLSAGSTNGLAFVLESFGLFGSVVIAALFLRLLSFARPPVGAVVLLAATLLGAPMFSSPIWWLWAGQLAVLGGTGVQSRKPRRRRAAEQVPDLTPQCA